MADLIPVGAATLRHAVEALDAPELATCWTDDMTLGWVYQYWNDPEREALDAKLHAGGKVEPHEIASKTQMFTERYMVDWLLQNSLGPMWLAMCRDMAGPPTASARSPASPIPQTCLVAWMERSGIQTNVLTMKGMKDMMEVRIPLSLHPGYKNEPGRYGVGQR